MARKGIHTYGYDLNEFVRLDPGPVGDWYASRIDGKRSFPVGEILGYGATPRYLHVAIALERLITILRRNMDAWFTFKYGEDMLYNRIWIEPLFINVGFITEESVWEIEIWNAYLDQSVFWTAVSVISQSGTDLDSPTLPYEIGQTADLVVELTVLKSGPPLQNTTWKLTIDGTEYDILVTGIRVVPVEPDPDWREQIKMSYQHETSMFETERFHEQRRPMRDESLRSITAGYKLKDIDNHRFFNILGYGQDKIFGVPLYQEKMYPTQVTQGTQTILLSNSNEYFWNMQNRTNFVMIVDHDSRITEIKEVLNFTDYQINLKADIVESFNVNTTVVYPALFCVVGSIRYTESTSHITKAIAEFTEFISG